MPLYLYRADDGEEHEEIVSFKDRQDQWISPSGKVFKHVLAPIARMADQWLTFSRDGIDGTFNHTFNTHVQNSTHLDKLCVQNDVRPVTEKDIDQAVALEDKREADDTDRRKRLSEVARIRSELDSTGENPNAWYKANSVVNGAREAEIAKRGPSEELKNDPKYPELLKMVERATELQKEGVKS